MGVNVNVRKNALGLVVIGEKVPSSQKNAPVSVGEKSAPDGSEGEGANV